MKCVRTWATTHTARVGKDTSTFSELWGRVVYPYCNFEVQIVK